MVDPTFECQQLLNRMPHQRHKCHYREQLPLRPHISFHGFKKQDEKNKLNLQKKFALLNFYFFFGSSTAKIRKKMCRKKKIANRRIILIDE
jgi:hypothetical protein